MKPIIQKTLGAIESADPVFVLQPIRENAFVHARLAIGNLIGLLQIFANIVRVEERHAARFLKTFPAERDNVSVSTDQDTEITEKGTHPANRLGAVLEQLKLVILLDDPWYGQILNQVFLDRHGTC